MIFILIQPYDLLLYQKNMRHKKNCKNSKIFKLDNTLLVIVYKF